MFELTDRDGLARLGHFRTPHGLVHTPVLLPVIHPDPSRQPISAEEMREHFGVEAVITSSYILMRDEALRDKAIAEGVHGLLGFPGTIMTDSGAFQQHVYGGVHAGPEEIIDLQNGIKSDIATPLDLFIEPDASWTEAEEGVNETVRRVREARSRRGEHLLAVPVQGGLYPDLRERSATLSTPYADTLAIGGIVPLMEGYRFADLARILALIRPFLPPEKPLHLFGLGHPMLFALGTLLGGDIFDTASYHKFARRGYLTFPEGSVNLKDVREDFCGCSLCEKVPISKIRDLPPQDIEPHLARHNLRQCAMELARVKQAIRDGEIWELAERRALSHPALVAAMRELARFPETFLPTEPKSRKSFLITSEASMGRPAMVKFQRRLSAYVEGKVIRRISAQMREGAGAGPQSLVRPASAVPENIVSVTSTPLGDVPIELLEVYPVGSLVSPDEFAPGERHRPYHHPEEDTDHGNRVSVDRALGIMEWCWGRDVREKMSRESLRLRHSRTSGRLREISLDGRVLMVVGNDGLPHPTFSGGEYLHSITRPPSHRVVASNDASSFVEAGKSLFSQFVTSSDPEIVPNQYVLIVDGEDRLLAVGRTLLSSGEMKGFRRGMAVRISAHRRPLPSQSPDTS